MSDAAKLLHRRAGIPAEARFFVVSARRGNRL
jgi:hypothetical protein